MKLSNAALGVIIAILLVCCCLTGGAFVVLLTTTGDSSFDFSFSDPTLTPTRVSIATATPTRTPTLSTTPRQLTPTNTRVIPISTVDPRAPTSIPATIAPSSLYAIIVPTPNAPFIVYPVAFDSTFKVVTYTVVGKTVNELSQSLERSAIPDPHDPIGRYYALTEWNLSSAWQWKSNSRGCVIDRASVTINMTMTLPALATRQGVATDVLTRWDKFIANAIAHEKGHVSRALDGARSYQSQLGNFDPVPSCDTMPTTLDNLFKRNLNAIDKLNVDYDVQTDHGTTQGAVFP